MAQNTLRATLSDTTRKKWGIPPKGAGPHKAEDYELPMPPADHARAKDFARAVIKHARGALARCDKQKVVGQIRKANQALYGTPTPTPAQKRAARGQRANNKKKFPHNEADRRVKTEAYIDVPAPEGSSEQIEQTLLIAARASNLFGGPAWTQAQLSQNGYPDDAPREWDISIMWLFPSANEAVVSNSRLAQMWRVGYTINADGTVTFGEPSPAEIEITAKGQEALRKARESGLKTPRFIRIQERGRVPAAQFAKSVSEARKTLEDAANGNGGSSNTTNDLSKGVPVQLISAGQGNPVDKNFYTTEFIQQTITENKFAGVQCYYDHPTALDEENQPERSVRKLAGWFSDPVQATHATQEGDVASAQAIFHPTAGDSMALNLMQTAQEYAQSYPDGEFIGFSIFSYGVADGTRNINGEEWTNVVAMTDCISVDLVTHAGARGGPLFDSQESNKMATASKNGKKTGRESATRSFRDVDLDIDIRTPEEKAADRKKLLISQAEHMLKNPIQREVAFRNTAVKEAAGDGSAATMSGLSDDQLSSVFTALGLTDDSPIAGAISDAVGSNDSGEGEGEGDGNGSGLEGSTEGEELSNEAIDAMSADDAKAALKKRIGTASASAANTANEASRRRITDLERENTALVAQIEGMSRASLTEKLVDKFKVPAAHRGMFERAVGAAKNPDDAIAAARDYANANFITAPGANVGVTREGQTSHTVPNMFRS